MLDALFFTGARMNFANNPESSAFSFSGNTAVRQVTCETTYAQLNERLRAVIVPKPGKRIVPQDLKALVKARLSAFKVPKEFFVVDEMPKNHAGKTLKREPKEKFVVEQQ